MSIKTLYSFTIYFRYPNLFGAGPLFNDTSSVGPRWDTAVTVMASTAEEAMGKVGEGYSDMSIVKVECPSIYPSDTVVDTNQVDEKPYLRAV